MRELKFRVWDIQSNSWRYSSSTNWVGGGIGNVGTPDTQPWTCMSLKGEIMSNDNMGGFVDAHQENYIIQQYTGLKDKSGKEVYEGDIVKYQNLIGVLQYSGEFMAFFIDTQIGSHLYGINFTKNEKINFEIVGNIFENPDLLK